MTVSIAQESPLTAEAHVLLDGSEAALRAVYAEDECFIFSAKDLDKPEITFLVARQDGVALGCVALVDYGPYGEVKRMFVAPAARGKGVAQALMQHLETVAARKHTSIKLETGDKLVAAVKMYKALGFSICGPFGDYVEHPASLFLEKTL